MVREGSHESMERGGVQDVMPYQESIIPTIHQDTKCITNTYYSRIYGNNNPIGGYRQKAHDRQLIHLEVEI